MSIAENRMDASISNTNGHAFTDAEKFLDALFQPGDFFLIRPVETWTENNQKKSRVDYQGVEHNLIGVKDQTGQWRPYPARFSETIKRQHLRSEQTFANIFYGVCPRVGTGGKYDQAWQIRTVRVLWADVDHCTVDEASERCKAAGLPDPSGTIASGNGAHIYWLLDSPFLIDDAGDPQPVYTEFVDQGVGKKKKARKYLKSDDGEKLYLDCKHNAPALTPKAIEIQDILAGIAAKIGGDHTTDLSRLLRVPNTMNRKDQRNGREPVPCRLVELHPERRYSIEQFKQYAAESPRRVERERLAKVRLPAGKKLTPTRQDKLHDLLAGCDIAEPGNRSEADYALCAWAVENGIEPSVVWAEAANVGKFRERGEGYFELTWAKAEAATREKIYNRIQKRVANKSDRISGGNGGNGGNGKTDGHGSKPQILVSTDEMRVVDEAIHALAKQENVFQRGCTLVHIVNDGKQLQGIARPEDSPRIISMRGARIRELLADAADWYKIGEEEQQVIHPPEWVVKAIDARGQWPEIRRLEAVVESPVIRADGSVLQKNGWDSQTGLFLHTNITLSIPDHPTRSDAIKAAGELLEVICDFPLKSMIHRSAWLAALLTMFSRHAIDGPSPLNLIDGNIRGCGKSLLADATSLIATGRAMPRMTVAREDEEMRKRITAIALSADGAVLLDNIPSPFGSASLDAALTARTWNDRRLGASEMIGAIPLNVVWFGSGNNVQLQADTSRRICHIRIESSDETPEERSNFQHPDLCDYVKCERPRLVSAALTMLFAYCLAGRPDMKLKPWGSYEAWSAFVRNAVVWCDLPDPGETRMELRAQSDREGIALRQLLHGWLELDPFSHGVTVSQAVTELANHPHDYESLRNALWELCPPRDGKTLNVRSIGSKLHHLHLRVVGGYFIDKRDTNEGARWLVGTVSSDSDDSSDSTYSNARKTKNLNTCIYTQAQHGARTVTTTPTVTSPGSACDHINVVESPTFDGFVNLTCSDCGQSLGCRKQSTNEVMK